MSWNAKRGHKFTFFFTFFICSRFLLGFLFTYLNYSTYILKLPSSEWSLVTLTLTHNCLLCRLFSCGIFFRILYLWVRRGKSLWLQFRNKSNVYQIQASTQSKLLTLILPHEFVIRWNRYLCFIQQLDLTFLKKVLHRHDEFENDTFTLDIQKKTRQDKVKIGLPHG